MQYIRETIAWVIVCLCLAVGVAYGVGMVYERLECSPTCGCSANLGCSCVAAGQDGQVKCVCSDCNCAKERQKGCCKK